LQVGNVTTATIVDLNDGTTYFFTARAINTAGLESGASMRFPTRRQIRTAHILTVNSETSSGSYAPPAGKQFDRWMDDGVILFQSVHRDDYSIGARSATR
jgi:hypothetical protein